MVYMVFRNLYVALTDDLIVIYFSRSISLSYARRYQLMLLVVHVFTQSLLSFILSFFSTLHLLVAVGHTRL